MDWFGSLTLVKSQNSSADTRPTICLLPGGPGLSSYTLRSLDILSRSFHLAYVDPPGTGGSKAREVTTYKNTIEDIATLLKRVRSSLVLCGHSFGALYASDLTRNHGLNIQGLILLAPAFLPATEKVL